MLRLKHFMRSGASVFIQYDDSLFVGFTWIHLDSLNAWQILAAVFTEQVMRTQLSL